MISQRSHPPASFLQTSLPSPDHHHPQPRETLGSSLCILLGKGMEREQWEGTKQRWKEFT